MDGIRRIIAHNIRLGRKLADDMTQGELARRLDIPARQLSDWERAVHRPTDKNLHRIATILGQPFHWFFVDHEINGAPAAAVATA